MRPLRASFVAALMSSGVLPDDGQTTVVRATRSCPVERSSNTPFHECVVSAGRASRPPFELASCGSGWPPFELADCDLADQGKMGKGLPNSEKTPSSLNSLSPVAPRLWLGHR